jgi:spore coat protein U-like protein
MKTAMRYLLLLLAPGLIQASAWGAVTCTVSATGTAFGNFHTGGGAKDTVGTIAVTCSGSQGDTVNYTVALNPGAGSFASRKMQVGASSLSYNLFTDASHTLIWGDGTSGTATVSARYSMGLLPVTDTYTVHGEIPAQTGPTAGSYLDTVMITVTWF